ncbi:60S ribosomal protein L36-like [Acomys russatus]|uniref:60S ribosomal protein L36-like n=1 Tax=Acomys russatus TaxID=60746 RepID=UPI0021E1EE37|nr:60S ribosomal protein L36-like [Acomys russatus]
MALFLLCLRLRRPAALALRCPMAPSLSKGHSKLRHSWRHGCLTKHTKFMWDMIREVCGFAPTEQCTMELLSVQGQATYKSSSSKGWARTSLAKRKPEELSNMLAAMRKAEAKRD